MKMVLFAVLLLTTALLTCSDTSAETGMPVTICCTDKCAMPEKATCQTLAHRVSVKDIPPVGCTIPLGQVAEMMNEKHSLATK